MPPLSSTQQQYLDNLKTLDPDSLDPEDLRLLDLLTQSESKIMLDPALNVDDLAPLQDNFNKAEGNTEYDKGIFESMLESWGPLIGGTFGGINPATVTIGTMAGEVVQQAYETMTENPNAPQTITESLRRIGGEGLVGNIGTRIGGKATDIGGGLLKSLGKGIMGAKIPGTQMNPLGKIMETLKAPTGRSLLPEEALAVEASKRVGVQLTPFEIKKTPILGRLETYGTQGLISGNIMRKFTKARVEAINSFRESLINKIGGPEKSLEALGDYLIKSIQLSLVTTDKAFAKKLGLSTSQATDLLNTGGTNFGSKWGEGAEETYKELIKNVGRIKPQLEGIIRQLGVSPKLTKAGVLKESLAKTLAKSGTTSGQLINRVFIPNNAKNLTALRTLMGQDWPMFQRALVTKLIGGTTFNLKGLKGELARLGDDSLRAVLDKATIDGLRDLGEVGVKTGIGKLEEVGANRLSFNMLNLVEGGLAVNVLRSGSKSKLLSIALFLSPSMIAKLVTSPGGIQYLTTGFKMSAKNKQAMEVAKGIARAVVASPSGLAARSALTSQVQPRSIESGRQAQNPFGGLLGGGPNVR